MKTFTFDYTKHLDQLLPLLLELERTPNLNAQKLSKIIKTFPKDAQHIFAKDMVVMAYRELAGTHGLKKYDEDFVRKIQMKPVRTNSGVTPVTVLTKPFPCPGKCIFCPNDIRMPKSYLADEPGAQRAERNYFDPYLQTYQRLQAFQNIGHSVDKVEFIILGGTWSYYPEAYQIWFIHECFRALNDFGVGRDDRPAVTKRYEEMEKELRVQSDKGEKNAPVFTNDPAENKISVENHLIHGDLKNASMNHSASNLAKTYNQTVSELYVAPERRAGFEKYQMATWAELLAQQKKNETAKYRNVGLVIETRPDNISEAEVIRIRKLGCTKTQIGFQSLQDEVLEKNKRGHDVAATRRAVGLLRQAGFKIHAHWMPNLYGSSVELDKKDYETLFNDPDFKPDELKIYPCSLIESAELMQYYQRGDWQPYSESELLDILTFCFMHTPEYCRLTRVVRDIPSTDIVVGNKKTNFREIAEHKLADAGQKSVDIRAREIRNQKVTAEDLFLDVMPYETAVSHEIFLQFVTKPVEGAASEQLSEKKIAAFLRLSLPLPAELTKPPLKNFIPELADCAIIREVHVYGQAVGLGKKSNGKAQHLGLGTQLIEAAKKIAREKGFKKLAVISAVGTREYYRQRGFQNGELYQIAELQ